MKLLLSMLAVLATCSYAGLTTVETSVDGVVLDLDTPSPRFVETGLDGGVYTGVMVDGAENLAEAGLPALPVFRTWIIAPIGADIDVSLSGENISTMNIPGISAVAPGIPSVPKDMPRDSYDLVFDPAVYVRGEAYPSSWVRLVDAGMMRGRRLILVEVAPVRWNPADRSVDVLNSATISLGFSGGDLGATFSEAERMAASGFEPLLSSMAVNYGTFNSFDGTDSPMGGYLIIAHPDFYETSMDDFVTWKSMCGYEVTLVSTATTGSTAAEIEAYILDALSTWSTPPQYVLLVGDTGFVPGNTATAYSGVTDLYYVTLDDGGWVPDAFIGRFSVTTTGQAIMMADRVIDYEQWAYSGSGAWLQSQGWIASSDNSSISEGTHNYCITNYAAPLGFTADKLYPATYGSTAADVVTAVNQGESMLTFSGHGSQTSWGDMSFGSSNFNQLTNDNMFPGVLSHACLTGDYGTATAWCETWTRTPSKGGLWFWGSVPSSYWTEDDVQEKGEYLNFLGNGIYWPMGFLNGGKLSLYAYLSGGGLTKYYFEGYNLMGDPSVEMWTWQTSGGVPMTMSVSHPASISGSGPVTVTVSGASDDALVCLYKAGEVLERDWTTGGSVTLYVGPATTGTMNVTVRRHNYKPYMGTISVTGVGIEGGEPAGPFTMSFANPMPAAGVVAITGEGAATLEVFDLTGRIVARPFQGDVSGTMSVNATEGLASGVYFFRLTGAGETTSRAVTVIR
ncbi:MAG: C25 family cysteine peptidase [Candidatus Fermentibacter sp.]|nr:C25 family cysteine peptidase [Candidatus Fermentibacter sp.]